jgi:hypothetical protein
MRLRGEDSHELRSYEGIGGDQGKSGGMRRQWCRMRKQDQGL